MMNYGNAYNPYMQGQQYGYGNANQNTRNNGIKWVQGIEGAKAFQMMPNSNDIMLDSENDGVFYIKTCDGVGMCNLRTFKYEEITSQPNQSMDMSEYVKKTELEALINNLLGGNAHEQTVQSAQSSKSVITK